MSVSLRKNVNRLCKTNAFSRGFVRRNAAATR